MILLTYDHDRLCPKCHFRAGTTEYQKKYHGDECGAATDVILFRARMKPDPDPWQYGQKPPLEERLRKDPTLQARIDAFNADIARLWEIIGEVPEHFDRECPNCKYRWAEAVA